MELVKKIIRRTRLFPWILRRWRPDAKSLEFYAQFMGGEDVCFDVGANVGNKTNVFRHLCKTVVVVEPQPYCMGVLSQRFVGDKRVKLIQKAVGSSEGEAQMLISDGDNLSSLSAGWVKSVKQSGRFPQAQWNGRQTVEMTTLDRLIEQFGTPSFIKIDVEGFEDEVIRGLTRPVRALSLEFVPEFFESTSRSLEHLARLGKIELNYALGESTVLALRDWVSVDEMRAILNGFRGDTKVVGDVYVRSIR